MGSIIPSALKGRKETAVARRWVVAFRVVLTYKRSARMYTTSKGSARQLADGVAALTVALVVVDTGS